MNEKRKKKKELSKQEFIELLRSHFEETLANRNLYLLPIISFINLSIIFFRLSYIKSGSTTKFNSTLFLGTIFCIISVILIYLYVVEYNTIIKLYYNDQEKGYKIAKDLITFIETKGKRRTKEVKKIFSKIKIYKIISKKLNKFYQFNIALSLVFFMCSILFTVQILFLRGPDLTLPYIISVLLIEIFLSIYFSFILSIRSKQYFNLGAIINLLEIAFQKDLYDCLDNIKQIISTIFKDINFEEYLKILDNWYSFYIGKYFENTELNLILFDLHNFYISLKMEEEFHDNLMDVKSKLLDDLTSYNKNQNKDEISKSQIVIEKIDNYLNLLDYKIKKKTEKWKLRNRKIYFIVSIILGIGSIITLLWALIAIFS